MRVRVKASVHRYGLTPERDYLVIGLSHDSFRVLDDEGKPVLFPRGVFDVREEGVPEDWVWDRYAEDEFYADPPELCGRGFYEDYFDGNDEAQRTLDAYLRRIGRKRGNH